ncbi:Uncharacterised protein [Helicobacter fennelliae]|uniref:Uncharacterized protein n=1 Tax=Helicobacter fennelliae TaxID=215 RepID=A0A2X3BG52_9HELI|nr:Uncharacterised protein [Helicobacter fennelliae]STP14385.1 Uncharacterised protein [Helicobacter fennelliae]STQ84483.1 Uncharacterised protein [Helicobacter fennelliae]
MCFFCVDFDVFSDLIYNSKSASKMRVGLKLGLKEQK